MKHQIGGRSLISWLFLLLACLALVGAGGLLLSGCGSSGPEYQQVVNEVNQKYGAHMKVDFNNDHEFYDYLDNVLANSIYYREINYDEVSRVLTLQTCTNRKDLEYLLVNARLI